MPPQSGQQDPLPNTVWFWKLILGILITLIVGASVGAYGFYAWHKTATVPATADKNTSDNSYFPYQIFDTPTYTNKALGFSITMPSSWTRYAIREDATWPSIVITVASLFSRPVQASFWVTLKNLQKLLT